MKDIIATKVGEVQFVAAGKSLHWSKEWKVFPDFLNAYLAGHLNPKWGEPQLRFPIEEQHPINQWYSHMVEAQRTADRNSKGQLICNTGAALSWLRLAYDLYLVEHNAELQKRFIRKLRHPNHFQGARFEVAVAAMLVVAGYDIDFVPERGEGKHPEYFAVHRKTGTRVAVEAKSRHRDGILGFRPDAKPTFDGSFQIDALLRSAVLKDTEEPLLVFIELNTPIREIAKMASEINRQLDASWQAVQALRWEKGFPSIGVVFYNDACPWFLTEPLGKSEPSIWASGFWPNTSRHNFPSKQLLTSLVPWAMQRSDVPHSFPYPAEISTQQAQ